jgi:hypothetical protein
MHWPLLIGFPAKRSLDLKPWPMKQRILKEGRNHPQAVMAMVVLALLCHIQWLSFPITTELIRKMD